MKLISCYIENYGSIKKESIIFDKNLTSICEENGYGKTTLASFLEAMFYGMDSDRANSKEFGERRHFNPFGGGRFGGNVVFSIGKDTYKIERYFDEKSESKDSLTVYKNSELSTIFGLQPGEKIFGIDKQSFERTIFINAREIEISSTGSINAKLNNFVEGSTDDTNTEKAIERLDKSAKEYKKSRAGNDLISKENYYLLQLNEKISNAVNIKASLPEKYDRLTECEKQLQKLQKSLEDAQKADLLLKDWEQYDFYVSNAQASKKEMEEIGERNPFGIPSSDELETLRDAVSAKTTLKKQTTKFLSSDEKATLSSLKEKFLNGVPGEVELLDLAAKIDKATTQEAELRSEESVSPTEYEGYLRKKFTENIPTEQTFALINDAVAEYEKSEKAYTETPDYIIEATQTSGGTQKTSKKKYLIAAIISAIIAVAGIGVIFAALIPGIILLVIGLGCLMGTGFIYLNKKASYTTPSPNSIQRINPEKLEKERAKNNAELKAKQIIAQFGYSLDNNVRYLVEKLKNDYAEYEKLVESDCEKNSRLETKREQCAALRKEICDYFAVYGFTGNDINRMYAELQKEINNYNSLVRTQDKLREQNKSTDIMIAENEKLINDFCAKYHFDPLTIENIIGQIGQDIGLYAQAVNGYKTNKRKAEEFKTEKNLETRPVETDETEIEEIKAIIDQRNKERSSLSLEIADCETEAEKLDDLYSEKQRHIELLNEYKQNYDILTSTIKLLKKADKQLKDKYVAPIKDNFVNYAEFFEAALGEKVVMTPNFEIRYERNGMERSEKHLSAGQRSICAFCFRMALIENMYTDEKPFLILDDPFVNLDQKHLDRVKVILKKISENLQIIYFTCHESRAV